MKSVRASRGKKAVGKQGRRATLDVAPAGYADWIRDVKASVHEARQRAARAVNGELVGLYWRIGRDIRARQATQGWEVRTTVLRTPLRISDTSSVGTTVSKM